MTVLVLEESQRRKWDGSDDVLFYAEPRLVHHLDQAFRTRLTALYTERIPKNAVVLDLMSSWVSHLPEDKALERVIGHGLNEKELAANPAWIATGCKTSTKTRNYHYPAAAWTPP